MMDDEGEREYERYAPGKSLRHGLKADDCRLLPLREKVAEGRMRGPPRGRSARIECRSDANQPLIPPVGDLLPQGEKGLIPTIRADT
jgi:hypothetical protein